MRVNFHSFLVFLVVSVVLGTPFWTEAAEPFLFYSTQQATLEIDRAGEFYLKPKERQEIRGNVTPSELQTLLSLATGISDDPTQVVTQGGVPYGLQNAEGLLRLSHPDGRSRSLFSVDRTMQLSQTRFQTLLSRNWTQRELRPF
jgi:hypothetical protein